MNYTKDNYIWIFLLAPLLVPATSWGCAWEVTLKNGDTSEVKYYQPSETITLEFETGGTEVKCVIEPKKLKSDKNIRYGELMTYCFSAKNEQVDLNVISYTRYYEFSGGRIISLPSMIQLFGRKSEESSKGFFLIASCKK